MSTLKIMPEWCKQLDSRRVDCYLSDLSEAHALKSRLARSIASYNDESIRPFSTISGISSKCDWTDSWMFAIPVDPKLRDEVSK